MPEITWRDQLLIWLKYYPQERSAPLMNLERHLRVLDAAFQLTNAVDEKLVREVLKAHAEFKRSYEDSPS